MLFLEESSHDTLTTEDDNDVDMWVDEVPNPEKYTTECIFCTRHIRFRNGTKEKLTKVKKETKKSRICAVLTHLNQQSKVEKLHQSDITYHHLSCLAEHEHKLSVSRKIMKEETIRQKVNLAALAKVKQNVETTVI